MQISIHALTIVADIFNILTLRREFLQTIEIVIDKLLLRIDF